MRAIIAAAGTGGHINPGIAIANKICKEEPDSEIIFVGTSRGIENDLVPRAGYELRTVEAYGLSKKISVKTVVNNFRTLKGFKQARKLVKDYKPDVVIGTGGYICGGVISSAHDLGIPTVIHESNAFPGKATKFLEKKLDKILLGFDDAKEYFTNKEKVVTTGNPTKVVGRDLSSSEKKKILTDVGLTDNMPVVLIFGGSQGAQKINESVIEIIKKGKNNNYQILWAAGPKQYDIVKEELAKDNINIEKIENAKIVPYIYNMEDVMNACDLIVARSGAMTITEIALCGKPSIFIPLSSRGANRQVDNARVLEKLNAARIILNDEVNGENLATTIDDLLKSPTDLKQMGENARQIAKYNVEDRIYKEIKELVK